MEVSTPPRQHSPTTENGTSPTPRSPGEASNSERRRRRSGEILQDAVNAVIKTVTRRGRSKTNRDGNIPAIDEEEDENDEEPTPAQQQQTNRLQLAKTYLSPWRWPSVFRGRRQRKKAAKAIKNGSSNAVPPSRVSLSRMYAGSSSKLAGDVQALVLARALWVGKGFASGCAMEAWRKPLTPLLMPNASNAEQDGADSSMVQSLALMCARGSADPLLVDYVHAALQSSDSPEVVATALGVARSLSDAELCQLVRREVEGWKSGLSTFERAFKSASHVTRYAVVSVATGSLLPRLERLELELGDSIVGSFETDQDRIEAAQELRDWIVKMWQLVAELILPKSPEARIEDDERVAEAAFRGLARLFHQEEDLTDEDASTSKTLARIRVASYLSSNLPHFMRSSLISYASSVLAVSRMLAFLSSETSPPSLLASTTVSKYTRAWLETSITEFTDPTMMDGVESLVHSAEAVLVLARLDVCASLRPEALAAAANALLKASELSSKDDLFLMQRCTRLLLSIIKHRDSLPIEQRLNLLERVARLALASEPLDVEATRDACAELLGCGASPSQHHAWLAGFDLWTDCTSTARHVIGYYLLIASSAHTKQVQVEVLEMTKQGLRFVDADRARSGSQSRWADAMFDAYLDQVSLLASSNLAVRELALLMVSTSTSSSRPASPSSRPSHKRSAQEGEDKGYLHPRMRARLCLALTRAQALDATESVALVSHIMNAITTPAINQSAFVLTMYVSAMISAARRFPERLLASARFALTTGHRAASSDPLTAQVLLDGLQRLDQESPLDTLLPRPIHLNKREMGKTSKPYVETRCLSGAGSDLLWVTGRATRETSSSTMRFTIRAVNVSKGISLRDVRFQAATSGMLSFPPKDACATAPKIAPDGSFVFTFEVRPSADENLSEFEDRTIALSWSAKGDAVGELIHVDLPPWTLSVCSSMRSIPEFEPFSVVDPQDFRHFWEKLKHAKRCKVTCAKAATTKSGAAVASCFPHTSRLDGSDSSPNSSYQVTGYACRSTCSDSTVLLITCVRTSETCAMIEFRSNARATLTSTNEQSWCEAVLGESCLVVVDLVTANQWPGGEEDESRFTDIWQLRRLEGWALPKSYHLREEEEPDVMDVAETTVAHFEASMEAWKRRRRRAEGEEEEENVDPH